MKSLWNDKEANQFKTDLDLRVYTSRLLGCDSSLVLHGGGNTSVKSTATNLFGQREDILYVKGSGWDLATIEAQGFAPVKMDMLLEMAKLDELSDTDMVKYQRLAMTNPSAPNPSVEAILHAIIPFKYVDHTHTDAVVTITNTDGGEDKIKEIYGENMLIIPYIMPGFVLAKLVYDMTRDIDWDKLDGMVLMNHGLFTFDDDAKKSYEKTIQLVTKAEDYLASRGATIDCKDTTATITPKSLASIRKEISTLKGGATISVFNDTKEAIAFSRENIKQISQQGPLTPDHVIRTKRIPAILTDEYKLDLEKYVKSYTQYFNDNKTNQTMLNPAPNFAIIQNNGTLSFGSTAKEVNIIKDINDHTFEAIIKAQKLGGYKALSPSDIFEVEYWSLEQAKLKKGGTKPQLNGKIAIVINDDEKTTSQVVKMLNSDGCAVVVLNKKNSVSDIVNTQVVKNLQCDILDEDEIQSAIEFTVKNFGGVDMVIGRGNEQFYKLLQPYLQLGIDPKIVAVDCDDLSYISEDIDILNLTTNGCNNIAKIISSMAVDTYKGISRSTISIG
jgi:rhamnose utilization protein RhaD (predicted bifunctional aldolase and dehydrogenase)